MKNLMIAFFYLVSCCSPAFAQLPPVQQQQMIFNNDLTNGGFESGTAGWRTYNDGASATPVDGTGGTVTNFTLTASTSTPLESKTSGLMAKGGSTSKQGYGISADFTTSESEKFTVLQCSLNYGVSSGTYADDEVQFWIYDVTNAALIAPAPAKVKNHALTSQPFAIEFQATSSTSYRLIAHVAGTSATDYTLKLDSFRCGRQAKLYGSPVTDSSATITPTVQFTGTYNARSAWWWRLGDKMRMQGFINVSSAGDGTDVTITLPGGYSIDTAKAGTTVGSNFGTWGWFDNSGSAASRGGFASIDSATTFKLIRNDTSADLAGSDLAGSDRVSWDVTIPIVGWSSTVIMSTDANNQPVAAQMTQSANQTGFNPNNSAVKVQFETSVYDTVGGNDTANDRYTARVPGYYLVSASAFVSSTNVLNNLYYMLIYKNGAAYHYGGGITTAATAAFSLQATTGVFLNSGDYVEAFIHGNGNNSASHLTLTERKFTVSRDNGQSQIATSDTVTAKYTTNTAQSINSATIVDFEDKSWDDTNSVTVGASWKYTAPVSGKYHVQAGVAFGSAVYAINDRILMYIYKGGVQDTLIASATAQSTTSSGHAVTGGGDVRLLAGEFIDIRVTNGRGATNTGNNPVDNYVSIERVGNY